jgi:hypothetical protein
MVQMQRQVSHALIEQMQADRSESVRRLTRMSEADIRKARDVANRQSREAAERGRFSTDTHSATRALYCEWLPKELPMRNGQLVTLTDTPMWEKHCDETEAILKYQHPNIPDAAWEAMGF